MTLRIARGVLVGLVVLFLLTQFGMAGRLLVERGIFLPVAVPVLLPDGLWQKYTPSFLARATA